MNAGFYKTISNFYEGKNISQPELYKNTYIELKGLEKEPTVEVAGNNGATAQMVYADGTAKIYIRSNGRTVVDIQY